MKEYETILQSLVDANRGTKELAYFLAGKWHDFVTKFPVGSRVVCQGFEEDVQITQDGRYYDDASDSYVSVSNGGLWPVAEIRKAPREL